jgi:hypothetical protein
VKGKEAIMKTKTKLLSLTFVALAVLLPMTLAACGGTTSAPVPATAVVPVATDSPAEKAEGIVATVPSTKSSGYENMTLVDENGSTAIDSAALETAISQVPAGELSDSEAAGLLFMREEEKLARDVYLQLYEKWEMAVFNNIVTSEQTHTEAVKTLIDRYGLEDPATGQGVGEFTNQDLQALYNQLVEQGSQSLVDALQVGAAIEEIDILDLQERIAQTDKVDIQLVYENLMKGSRNHLRAFISVIERQGETYQPQYLSQGVFDEIVSTPTERGTQ